MSSSVDIVIIGAGPAGSSAAYFLARAGVKVLLLDKAAFPRDKTCGDGIVPRALPVLAEMGILDSAKHYARGWQLDQLEVTAPSGHTVHVPIPSLPHAPNHALIIPRLTLDNLILQQAIAAGADFRGGVHVRGIQTGSTGVTVAADEPYHAALAIVATGANTALLNAIGLNPPAPKIVAARAYFENIAALPPRFQFRFDGVPLPGYGWIFPLSATSANVGAGFIRTGKSQQYRSAQTAYTGFIRSPALQTLLGQARQVGALKSFPIRTDFASAPTYIGRTLLVGEAAGLVNPLTGDGIDFALESGQIAANHIINMLRLGDFSRSQMQTYDTILRQRYQSLFRFSGFVSRMALNRRALDWLVPLAAGHAKLPEALVNILLGAAPAPQQVSLLRIVKGVAARL